MHLGLIGGIGPAATEFYYRGLTRAQAAMGARMELTIVHADVVELVANLKADNRAEQAQIFVGFVERLKAAGADCATITSLAGHFCFAELEAISPLPLINAFDVLDAHFLDQNIRLVGVLGSGSVMQSKLYGAVKNAEVVVPGKAELDLVGKNYLDMAIAAKCSEAQRERAF